MLKDSEIDFDKTSLEVADMIADALANFADEIRQDPKKIYDSEWSWADVNASKKLTIDYLDIKFK
ncbi:MULTISPECIES: hypothetical protein [Hafniaceae]|uniref:Uncharacterized protein n=1 Tax=Obesumbacterium proteus ATCC 12841 TaxID=1354268 RepID=A0AA91IRN6_9GAMM|nr:MULTISPECIES: hypothetical protein [Hafniaceae]AMO81110.1 hypothetical protein DSM2777_08695 [Obesumbacterium proteus]MDX6839757.1 hypothetical protein [Hafnia paralvei]OAT60791.1 hypothetical protein M993_00465 [Obesumbacterium proteus ATCC 12841]STQ71463.1 Uncharacterised protein [Hafnia alvei]STQ74406.1 Uncharacterised protein [Hafnia alvei]